MTNWCSDPSRDEAVRAAEDGRSGPLPTLEEAIAAITQKGNDMATKAEIQAADYRAEATSERTEGVTDRRPVGAGGGGNVTGLRTERVTLEITHDLDAPLGDWIVQVLDESLGFDEYVRVVEEAKLAPAANADGGSNHAAPAASRAAGTEANG